jgi:phosphoglycolate phosphatase-like HAD superfamily hydrolase
MNFTHAIFDMDGTLVDTVMATYEACRKTTKELGFPHLTEEVLKSAMGISGLGFFRKCYPDMDDDKLREFARHADTAEVAQISKLGKAVLFDGIEEMLKRFSDQGIPLFIASTGSIEHVGTTLNVTGIRNYFTGVYCDHPDKAESIGRIPEFKNSITPAGCEGWIMVGDKRIDANAARHHGIFSIGACWGYCDEDEKKFFDKLIFSPEELLEFVF